MPSGQDSMRRMGSTALTTSSTEMDSGVRANANPPLGPRRDVTTPASTRSLRILEMYLEGTLVPSAIACEPQSPSRLVARNTTARRAYSAVLENMGSLREVGRG